MKKIEVEDKLNTLKSIRSKFNRDKLGNERPFGNVAKQNRAKRKGYRGRDRRCQRAVAEQYPRKDFEITLGQNKIHRKRATDAMKKGLANAPRNGSRIKLGSYNGLDLYYTSFF